MPERRCGHVGVLTMTTGVAKIEVRFFADIGVQATIRR
jgi:hypothetical protein